MSDSESWSGPLTSGAPLMDAEHGFQIGLIDEVEEQLRTGHDERRRQDTIRRLVEFTSAHCATEERAMRTHGYPALEEHARAHEELLDQLLEIEREHAAGDARALVTVDRLRDWLSEHITRYDLPCAAWFGERKLRGG